jgi:hypothetical protein
MLELVEQTPTLESAVAVPSTGYTGPARVVGYGLLDGDLMVSLADGRSAEPTSARMANPSLGEPRPGDTVLVTLGDAGEAYVIGSLSSPSKVEPSAGTRSLALPNGARVEVERSADEADATVRLFSARDELVLEWDPACERMRVCVPQGDLEFATERGGIHFDSADEIRMNARSIELSSTERVELGVKDATGQLVSALTMASRRLRLKGDEVGIDAVRACVQAGELSCTADTVRAQSKSVKLTIGRLKCVADQVVQRANDVYSTVTNLSQLKAGRVRTLVESTWWMKSKRSYLRSGEDFKLDADKIHLG